jgi:hypothetical protein
MELKEKILKSVFEAVELVETKYMTEDEIIAMIGGISMGVECVLENIENDMNVREEIASKIINELQGKYIKSKEKIYYWEDIK